MASSVVFWLSGCTGSPPGTFQPGAYPVHRRITVTVFWIGEAGTEENGYIANAQSVWDDNWVSHYGGVDDPLRRNGFFPAAFTPAENPFYAALPYNDYDEDGRRKPAAYTTVYWSGDKDWTDLESMCKNRWIRISKDDRVAYAQWEDAGPFGEDDVAYVFGDGRPRNTVNHHAGLDVSPAVRDYLGLEDIDEVDWMFVDAADVPDGPWLLIPTVSNIDWE